MKRIARILLAFTLCITLFWSTGCGSHDGETPLVASGSNYVISDPVGDWGFPAPYTHYPRGPGYARMSLLFDTLVWKNQGGLKPALAWEWEYLSNEEAYLFELQEDVLWHDGTNFSATDVAFTFAYMEEHPYGWVDTSVVQKVEALGDHQVKIHLTKPYAPFIDNIAGTLPILPEHVYRDIDNPGEHTTAEAAVGTGPFTLKDYSKAHGTYLYEANPDYYLGEPVVGNITFVKTSEEMVPAALEGGRINAGAVPPETVEELEQRFTLIEGRHDWAMKLMVNHRKQPFAAKEFRQALAYGLDLGTMTQTTRRGYAAPGMAGLIPPQNPWSNPTGTYEYNPAEALRLLEGIGIEQRPDGALYFEDEILTVEILVKTDKPYNPRDGEYLAQHLEKLGMQVDLRSLDDKSIDMRIENWDFDLAISGHGGLDGDPAIFHRMTRGASFNSARYDQNERLNELLESQFQEMDKNKRRQLLNESQVIYAQELPAITLYYPTYFWVHDGKVPLYFTPGGLGSGVPLPINKMAFVN